MIDLRPALALAKQYRTCPPLRVLEDPDAGAFAKEHLSVCPHCSAEMLESLGHWDELVERWKEEVSAPVAFHNEILPGQIRFLRPELGRRRDGFFYNPPGVLVLEKSPGIEDGYRVAQLYHDIALAGLGDLVLDDAKTGAGELMVECWNTYSMKGSYLGPPVGAVSDEVLAALLKMEKDPDAVPDRAKYPHPMSEHDVRIYFRQLEVEVGYVFASAAASELMAELEKPRLVLVYDSPEKMKADIQRVAPGIVWPDRIPSLEEGLVLARLPDAALAMAAAEDQHDLEPANFVLVQDGEVQEIRPLQFVILHRAIVANGFAIGGRIIGLPAEEGEHHLLCFFMREGQAMLPAHGVQWDESTGHFTVRFKTENEERGRLKLAVFCNLEAD